MLTAIKFVLGVVLLIGMLNLLREKNASRIRKSRYWPVAFLGWPLGLSVVFGLTAPVLNGLPINDDVAVPVLFVGMIVAIIVVFSYQMYRIRHPRVRAVR